METTFTAVYIALQTAPLIALIFTVPHTIFGYIREKSLNVRRSTYTYIFVLYFLCAYFMTMLPLPSMESFENMRPISELVQLIPFKNFFDIKAETVFRDIAILAFNVILTVPLGFFLRFLFGFNFKKTVLAGFLTASLYEFTQLTGIFFIYPRPYRIFDIDDFIINTLGAIIGYIITPLLARILPPPSESRRQLQQGSEASFFQRCVGAAIDFCAVSGISAIVCNCIPALERALGQSGSLARFPLFYCLFLAICFLYALLLPGGTLGTRLSGLVLMTRGGKRAARGITAMRTMLIFSSTVGIPFWVYFFMNVNDEYAGLGSIIWVFFGALLMMCAASVMLEMMFNAVTHGSSMFYDRLFDTYIAYGSSRKTSLFGIRVIDIKRLDSENIDLFSAQICDTLAREGVAHEAVTKVRLMAEGVMLDWAESGLENTLCELRLDNRYRRKALMLSVPGEDKANGYVNGCAEMLSGLDLTLKTYYAGEKNICIIFIPEKNKFSGNG